jgi:UPF0755 protein
MVEQGVPLRETPSRPSRGRIAARRAVALVVLAGGIGIAVWLVVLALGSIRDSGAKEAKPVVPVAPPVLRIIFPEGFTRAEMAQRITAVDRIARNRRKINPRLSSRAYLAATARSKIPATFAEDRNRRNLEGFLFPSTYQFEPQTTSRQLVNRQLQAFEDNWAQVDLAYAKSKNLTPYDVLIIASLIEKEVIAPEERRLVAAVIYNRLKARMNLGIDATTRYGLNVPGTEPLRQSHLASDNPYNTRNPAILGLPPTPIANPGLASMQAAAHPANVDYLFFVRKADKIHHFFTESEQEFNAYLAANGVG